ncbi:MAG: efflux RND transporter periplasmic adaptor subunit [Candidatus Sumerlaeaceae bacterium]|nr:efflux RND transporter periplasmic adaptor subunit [Candidatus Sumerlaeaceae bacterium]
MLRFLGGLLFITCLLGCHGNGSKAELGKLKPEPEAVAVATVRPEETSRTEYVQVTGNLAAEEDSDVASKREGIVWRTFVERGTVVRKGEPLVAMDPTDEINALDAGLAAVKELEVRLGVTSDTEQFDPENQPEVRSARADYELAKTNHERATRLFREGTINQAEFDQSATQLESARQRYALAKHQVAQLFASLGTQKVRVRSLAQAVADTTITAPFDGVVVERYVSPGEWLGKGARVARVVQLDPLRLQLTVPERNAAQVAEGQEVEFSVGAYPERKFYGRVKYLSPALSNESRALVVEAEVPNPNGLLKPGFFATARLKLPGAAKSYLAPLGAVRRERDVAKVFVVKDGVARERVVRLGDTFGDKIEVFDSLNADDILAADASKLSDGVRVK